jgi:hypothetical protein
MGAYSYELFKFIDFFEKKKLSSQSNGLVFLPGLTKMTNQLRLIPNDVHQKVLLLITLTPFNKLVCPASGSFSLRWRFPPLLSKKIYPDKHPETSTQIAKLVSLHFHRFTNLGEFDQIF